MFGTGKLPTKPEHTGVDALEAGAIIVPCSASTDAAAMAALQDHQAAYREECQRHFPGQTKVDHTAMHDLRMKRHIAGHKAAFPTLYPPRTEGQPPLGPLTKEERTR